jgi:hypothetical protein
MQKMVGNLSHGDPTRGGSQLGCWAGVVHLKTELIKLVENVLNPSEILGTTSAKKKFVGVSA